MYILAGWAFVAFLYFKITFDAVFYQDLSVLASLLMGGILGVFIYFISGQYALKLFKYNANPNKFQASLWELISKTKWQFIGSVFAYTIISRLIIFGFSKELSRNIRAFQYDVRLDEIRDEFILFVCLTIVPLLIHYIISLWPTYQNCLHSDGVSGVSDINETTKSQPSNLHSSADRSIKNDGVKQNPDGSYQYKEFRYEKLEDALNYAKLQTDKNNPIDHQLMTTAEIHDFGIEVVVGYLQKEGYSIEGVNANLGQNPQIVARKGDLYKFIAVRTACYPNKGKFETPEEAAALIKHAEKHGALPYFAAVGIANADSYTAEQCGTPVKGAPYHIMFNGLLLMADANKVKIWDEETGSFKPFSAEPSK